MTTFSANLGFLWPELALPEAILAAKQAGFDAVECHWPYDIPARDVHAALEEADLPMLGINTIRGDVAAGDMGLCALPDRSTEARNSIDQAIEYASLIGAKCVHVMAGNADGTEARDTFKDNLAYASAQAAPYSITILIEPLNHYDAPDYFLKTTGQAHGIMNELGAENLKLMFDCYHVQLMEGDLTHRLQKLLPLIGHIQFAGVPSRGVPDEGEVNYAHLFRFIDELGYNAPLGAEYKPAGPTQDSLDWMTRLR